jgi:hypothetical protein
MLDEKEVNCARIGKSKGARELSCFWGLCGRRVEGLEVSELTDRSAVGIEILINFHCKLVSISITMLGVCTKIGSLDKETFLIFSVFGHSTWNFLSTQLEITRS